MNAATNSVSGARLIIPAMIGNALEWYDFSLYGYFAVIISALFFPTLMGLLPTYNQVGSLASENNSVRVAQIALQLFSI